ncbi:MAG: hypothetical protein GEV09_01995 [Pseudonocardiaceae bacterium]|nr:hypothetical protein [Pseudonocardiaceae bacterium]
MSDLGLARALSRLQADELPSVQGEERAALLSALSNGWADLAAVNDAVAELAGTVRMIGRCPFPAGRAVTAALEACSPSDRRVVMLSTAEVRDRMVGVGEHRLAAAWAELAALAGEVIAAEGELLRALEDDGASGPGFVGTDR